MALISNSKSGSGTLIDRLIDIQMARIQDSSPWFPYRKVGHFLFLGRGMKPDTSSAEPDDYTVYLKIVVIW